MQLAFTKEQDAWREEVRTFLREELPPEKAGNSEFNESEEYWDFARSFTKKVSQKGWIGLTWPTEYGGLGRSLIDRLIFSEEFSYADAPLLNVVGWSAAAAALFYAGTEAQKRRYLPKILASEELWVEGFSEPDAGSDLASLTTRAVRDGDGWVINGQKTYTTWGTHGDLIYLAARTDPDSPKHQGISLFCVEMDAPGVSLSPLDNIGEGRQNHTYLDDVRVDNDHLIGEPGQGWDIIMNSFYGGVGGAGNIPTSYMDEQRRLDELVEHCRATKRGGELLIDDPNVRELIGEMATMIEAERLLVWQSIGRKVDGRAQPLAGALHPVVMKEAMPRFSEIIQEVVGPLSQLSTGAPFAPLGGQPELWYRQSFKTHGGGTSQVKRMVLATRGLGLPK